MGRRSRLSARFNALAMGATVAVSPRFGPIALALVRREAPVGSVIAVGDGAQGEVVELPFT